LEIPAEDLEEGESCISKPEKPEAGPRIARPEFHFRKSTFELEIPELS
jgi:hypothetical protein